MQVPATTTNRKYDRLLRFLPHFRREVDCACVSGDHVPLKLLLLVRPELFSASEDANLVVQRLRGQPLLVRGLRHGRHRVHGRIGDVLRIVNGFVI